MPRRPRQAAAPAAPPLTTAGTYAGRVDEQRRLSALLPSRVSGATHEAEHVAGYHVIAPDLPRGESPAARSIENRAPAYQEVRAMHRAHIGTGTHANYRGTGESSADYRQQQRSLLTAGDVSSAVQLNQLNYAHQPGFQAGRSVDFQQADDSFGHMVDHMQAMPLRQAGAERSLAVSPIDRAEMYLSREAARSGQWPSADRIQTIKRRFGAG